MDPVNPAFYIGKLKDLLPDDAKWPHDVDGSILDHLLAALDAALMHLHNRGLDLGREMIPSSTRELLPDWEQVAGLPDPCGDLHDNLLGQLGAIFGPQSLGRRRSALTSKLRQNSGQSIRFFYDLAIKLGNVIDITEWRPFVCGQTQIGQARPLGAPAWRHHWSIMVYGQRITRFRCGQSMCGVDHLTGIDRAKNLECYAHRFKPAQSYLTIGYQQ